MGKSAVFIDLDRTLLCRAPGQVLNKALMDEGVLPQGRTLPGDRLLYAVNDRLGENLCRWGWSRAAARGGQGMASEPGAGGREAGRAELIELVAPSRRRPGRLPRGRPPVGVRHHHPGRHDHPVRRGDGVRRRHRHYL